MAQSAANPPRLTLDLVVPGTAVLCAINIILKKPTMKHTPPFVLMIILALLLTACGNSSPPSVPAANTPRPIVAAATSQPAAAPTTAPKPGVITGTVYLMAPPTPPIVVYAVDQATGNWVSAQTAQSDGPAAFTLQVPPGTYQLFAAVADGHNIHLGYTQDGLTLAKVIVAAGQFQSSFASDLGTAQITYVDTNIIHWQITTPPNGEYYLPAEATLTRK